MFLYFLTFPLLTESTGQSAIDFQCLAGVYFKPGENQIKMYFSSVLFIGIVGNGLVDRPARKWQKFATQVLNEIRQYWYRYQTKFYPYMTFARKKNS
jgi:hypothetical protein